MTVLSQIPLLIIVVTKQIPGACTNTLASFSIKAVFNNLLTLFLKKKKSQVFFSLIDCLKILKKITHK